MSEIDSELPDQLNLLAQEFAERCRRGDRPSPSEYAAKYPALAGEIRDLFPAMALIEQFGSVAGPATGVSAQTATADGTALRQLGEYRILREVARGGMGIVYEAVQESLGRHVALKVLPFQSLASATHRERFRREARAAANLHHTNIVPVFGVGEHDGIHYFAMQFIQGQALDSVLREVDRLRRAKSRTPEGPAAVAPLTGAALSGSDASASLAGGLLTGRFPGQDDEAPIAPAPSEVAKSEPAPRDPSSPASDVISGGSGLGAHSDGQYFRSVARVGVQVADALAYAHQQGVLHRDVKPSNLLLDCQGTVWVTDFGLAKSEGTDELTSPGDFVGTLRYMAPERFNGRVDPRSDVFSLGLTLYEMVTLRPAFTAPARAQVVERLLRAEPARPRQIDGRIPADLETLILKAIAKEPERRYQSAGAMADDLRRFLADRPIQARRTRWPERCGRWCRRNPALAGLTATVLALLVTVAVVGLLDAARLRLQLGETQRAQGEATHRLYRSLVEQTRAGRLSRGMGQRLRSLAVLSEAATMAREMKLPDESILELRNEAIACLALPDLRVAKEWDGLPDGTVAIGFDDTLERYARVDRQGTVSIRRVAEDAEIYRLPSLGSGEAWPYFSPDGQYLALNRGGRAKVWKLVGPEPVEIIDEPTDVVTYAFSWDSRQFAIARPDRSIHLYDLSSGQQIRHLNPGLLFRSMAFHPGGKQLALSSATGVQIRDLATGDVVVDLPQPDCGPQLAWNPDGKSLACRSGRDILVWDVATQTRLVGLEGHRSDGIWFSYNHAGDQIASSCWDGTLRIWDVRTGQQVFGTRTGVMSLRFSRDDRMLAAGADGKILRLWEVVPALGYRTLARVPVVDKRDYGHCAISPTGRLLAVGMSDGVGLWDLASGASLGDIPLPRPSCVLFEPAGALLTTGPTGLQRWPVDLNGVAQTAIRIGPSEQLPLPTAAARIAISRNGQVIASAEFWGGLVWRRDQPGPPIRLSPHRDTRNIAVSPDGCWVATGSHWYTQVKIWDARTGALAQELPLDIPSDVCFSPDGRWLATTGGGCRLWAVGSWQPGPHVGGLGPVAFSADGKLLAVDTVDGAVRLVDPETGREYARLDDPNRDRAKSLNFSPDGTQLITTTNDSHSIHIWDLKLIRQQFTEMGLD